MIRDKRKFKKGFTLIELMVVIFIIGILSAVAIPMMRARSDSAKWAEGKASAGVISTAARAYIAEKGDTFNYTSPPTTFADLGFANGDIKGKYFSESDFTIQFTNGGPGVLPTYIIRATTSKTGEAPQQPTSITLTSDGTLTEIP